MSEDITLALRLTECERTIERGLQTFVEVGEALREVRDSRLYRESHGTFEDYCEQRWGFTDRRARQLMQTAEIGTVVPVENERQARELTSLADDKAEVLAAFTEAQAQAEALGKPLTAKVVKDAVTKRVGRLEREAETEAREGTRTCDECGKGGRVDSKNCEGWAFSRDGEGNETSRCADCAVKAREAKGREQEEWWQSLTEEEREQHTRTAEDREDRRKLDGSLRGLGDPEGEGSLADYLRHEFDALAPIDLPRHPDHLAALRHAVDEIAQVVNDFKAHIDGKLRADTWSRSHPEEAIGCVSHRDRPMPESCRYCQAATAERSEQ